jgi:F-type H+-transporting ATPase subunit alpha
MTQLRATGLSKEAEARLRRGEAINQLIVQDKNRPVSLEKQIVYLYALHRGLLDELSSTQVKQFKESILEYCLKRNPDFVKSIRQGRELTEELKQQLEASLKEYINETVR